MGKIVFSTFVLLCLISKNVSPLDSLIYKSPATIDKKKLSLGIALGSTAYLGGMTYLYFSHYDSKLAPFHFYNDIKGYLQIDKFQHAFGSYMESYIGYHWLRNSGVEKNKALLYGGTLGFILQSPKEILDGFYEPTGFSWGDMAANAFGPALLISQEMLFNDQIVKYKFSISRSEYIDIANGYFGRTWLKSFFKDFNGQTAWFSFNANKLIFKKDLPNWVNIAVGYSANGMIGQFENISSYKGVIIPETQRYRQYLLSLDIDWPKVKTKSKFMNIILKGLVFIKMPFPAIEINSKGQFKGYWLYF